MKFELEMNAAKLVKELMAQLEIDDTQDNRVKFCRTVFNIGIATQQAALSLTAGFLEQFPTVDLKKAFTDEFETVDQKKNPPSVCLACGHRVLFSGNKWACNCQVYEKGPLPEITCPNCHTKVEPKDYYWVCSCNRYSEAPPNPNTAWFTEFPLK